MKSRNLISILLLINFSHINYCSRIEQIDSEGKYVVSWRTETADGKLNNSIVFSVDVKTHGYIGFGLSPKGGMTGADIVIGGVYPNGTTYFRDAFGVGNQEPVFDDTCNWRLIDAWENETHTHLEFSRLLDTCDKQDVVIQNDTNHLIWAIGETDDLKYHGKVRGSYTVNLLDPPFPALDLSKLSTWRMTNTMEMLNESTTYWCTIHKTPSLSTKHHIVGFQSFLPTPEALRHTHHFLVHECNAPSKYDDDEQFFESYVESKAAGHCYDNYELSQYCRTYLFSWAVGGKMVLFPEHVGFPINENGMSQYFMLEIHYDNPNKLNGVTFESGIEFFYTTEIRKYDSGMLVLGHSVTFGMTIPPKTEEFVIAGHCSPDCTNKIPSDGVQVFNVLLHSHLLGRKLKVRHFRNGTELPWLASDDNYSFDYQQNRPLREEVQILPGDHLITECSYDTTKRKNVTIAGLSTREEMCYSFLWYYPRIGLAECQSTVSQESLLKEAGINSINWVGTNDPLVAEPSDKANKTYTQVLDTLTNWTSEKIASFQNFQRYSLHHVICGYQEISGNKTHYYQINKDASISYPNVSKSYQPLNNCPNKIVDT